MISLKAKNIVLGLALMAAVVGAGAYVARPTMAEETGNYHPIVQLKRQLQVNLSALLVPIVVRQNNLKEVVLKYEAFHYTAPKSSGHVPGGIRIFQEF